MRTDLTRVCEACKLRLRAGHQSCPSCGSEELLESDLWCERRKNPVKPTLKQRGHDSVGALFTLLTYLSLAVLVLGGALSANVHMFSGDVEMTTVMVVVVFVLASVLGAAAGGMAWLVLFFVLFICVSVYDWIRDLVTTDVVLPTTVEPGTTLPATPPAATGSVEACEADGGPGKRLLTAPVSETRCVAYGLCGRCSGDEIDDGEMVSFYVVSESGDRVLIEPPPAQVELTAWAPAPLGGDAAWERLDAVLLPRGVDTEAGCAELREACLREGDRVSVWGRVEEQADPRGEAQGFRSAPTVEVLRGAPADELLIRQHGDSPSE